MKLKSDPSNRYVDCYGFTRRPILKLLNFDLNR